MEWGVGEEEEMSMREVRKKDKGTRKKKVRRKKGK